MVNALIDLLVLNYTLLQFLSKYFISNDTIDQRVFENAINYANIGKGSV